VHAETADPFRGIIKCVRKSCSQRWMAEPLDAGSVRAQLLERFEDAAIADDIMRRFHLPESIDAPAFLQMPLNAELWNGYIDTRHLAARARQRELLNRLVDWLRRRPA
jgi:hypothetical protein